MRYLLSLPTTSSLDGGILFIKKGSKRIVVVSSEPDFHTLSSDRRRHKRLKTSFPASLRTLCKPHEKYSGALVHNLSLGGLMVVTPNFFPKGDHVVVLFSMPGGVSEPMRTICRVVWVRPKPETQDHYECGLQFVEIDAKDKALIASSLERLETLPSLS